MNLIRQFTFQAVREFDDAIIKALREDRIEDVMTIKQVREDVFNQIDEASGDILRLEDAMIRMAGSMGQGRTEAPASQVVNALAFAASALAAGMHEANLERLASIEVDEEKPEPSEVVAQMVHRAMDRIILNMVDTSEDIGRIRLGVRTVNAVRDDLVVIVVLESHQDLMNAAQLMERYMNERRSEKLGLDVTQTVHRLVEDIRDYVQSLGHDAAHTMKTRASMGMSHGMS